MSLWCFRTPEVIPFKETALDKPRICLQNYFIDYYHEMDTSIGLPNVYRLKGININLAHYGHKSIVYKVLQTKASQEPANYSKSEQQILILLPKKKKKNV